MTLPVIRDGPGSGTGPLRPGQRRAGHHLPDRGAVRSGDADAAPPFYVTIVDMGLSRDGRDLMAAEVRRTSDGHVTATVPALPAGWILGRSVSVTADDRTFTIAGSTMTVCPSSTATQTRFYQFTVTSTGHVTGLRAVGKPVVGDMVSEFAASPDGTKVAYAQQGCAAPASAALYAGVIHVMNLASGAVRSWHNTVSAATPARVTTQIGALSWTASGRTLVADYQWKLTDAPGGLAVLGLDATSSGGSLQAHSHLLFSQVDHCTVCVYTALTSADGSTLTGSEVLCRRRTPPQNAQAPPVCAVALLGHRAAERILYRRAPGRPSNEGTCTSAFRDGQGQHWFLINNPEQFGWISGGKLVPLPIKAKAGLLAINW